MPRRNYDKMYQSEEKAAPAEEPVVKKASASEEKETKAKKTTAKVPFMGVVTGGLNLNVRKTPGGAIIGSLSDGAQVRVLNNDNPDWYQIEFKNGFVMSKFIKKV